jgi:hypothetical protein
MDEPVLSSRIMHYERLYVNPTLDICMNGKVMWYVNAYDSTSHIFYIHGN